MKAIILITEQPHQQFNFERGIILVKDNEAVILIDGPSVNHMMVDEFKGNDPLEFLIPDRNYCEPFVFDPEPSRIGWTQKVKSQLFFPGVTHQPTLSPARNREYKSKSDDEY